MVWGDEDAYLFQSFQNDKRDSISRVCARLGGDKTSKADPLESESYEVCLKSFSFLVVQVVLKCKKRLRGKGCFNVCLYVRFCLV